jgi:hypothetical protein
VPRLERHGHERRLIDLRGRFRRSARRAFSRPVPKRMGRAARNAGLLILGAGLGASATILLDTTPSTRAGSHTLGSERAFYASCRDAFQDGRVNIRTDEPGYRLALDADRDGLACEPYAGPRR